MPRTIDPGTQEFAESYDSSEDRGGAASRPWLQPGQGCPRGRDFPGLLGPGFALALATGVGLPRGQGRATALVVIRRSAGNLDNKIRWIELIGFREVR
jgi:hypothetical protein